jgi:hemoglobin
MVAGNMVRHPTGFKRISPGGSFFAAPARLRYPTSGIRPPAGWLAGSVHRSWLSQGENMRIRQIGIVLALVLSIVACGDNKKGDTTPKAGTSLYDRLGKKDGITAVVADFVNNAANDEKIKHFFANADAKGLQEKLVDQICEATGGPCKYTGKDMKTAHTGMKITEEDFNALVGDLVKSLDKFKVPEAEKNELLGALGGMKGDIVGQ